MSPPPPKRARSPAAAFDSDTGAAGPARGSVEDIEDGGDMGSDEEETDFVHQDVGDAVHQLRVRQVLDLRAPERREPAARGLVEVRGVPEAEPKGKRQNIESAWA